MTQAIDAVAPARSSHVRIVGAVSTAHFVSHYYILLLAPLMPFVRAEYGVSYTEIGLAFAAFNIVSAALQTPAGFLVDWLGARILLIAGLLIGAAAFAVVGLTHSFWLLVAMFGLAGVGNTVYHPADYALLSQHVRSERIGQAFSIHTFAGMLGSAATPPAALMMQAMWGWRGAMIGAAALGLIAVVFLIVTRDHEPARPLIRKADAGAAATDWQVLLSAPILLSLGFFVLLAMISAGINNYSVVAFGALYGTPVETANAALTGNLLLSAIGVLVGGALVGRTRRHSLVASLGLAAAAAFTLLVAEVDLSAVALIASPISTYAELIAAGDPEAPTARRVLSVFSRLERDLRAAEAAGAIPGGASAVHLRAGLMATWLGLLQCTASDVIVEQGPSSPAEMWTTLRCLVASPAQDRGR